MKTRFASLALVLALVAISLVAPGNVAAQDNPFVDIPVTGTFDRRGTFDGVLDITRFAVQNNQLVAIGTLSGTLFNAGGIAIGQVQNISVTLPVTDIQGTCEILELTLGPLDLDLLGLLVHLDEVHLEITAESGPGNLLGNLLCQIAGLLDSDGSLQQIARLLNRILDIFG